MSGRYVLVSETKMYSFGFQRLRFGEHKVCSDTADDTVLHSSAMDALLQKSGCSALMNATCPSVTPSCLLLSFSDAASKQDAGGVAAVVASWRR